MKCQAPKCNREATQEYGGLCLRAPEVVCEAHIPEDARHQYVPIRALENVGIR